jgi:Ca2+-binding EF-hand superfamily protein
VLESYLIFSKVSQDERRRVNLLFKQLDRNSDGFIEKTELIQAYK